MLLVTSNLANFREKLIEADSIFSTAKLSVIVQQKTEVSRGVRVRKQFQWVLSSVFQLGAEKELEQLTNF